MQEEENQINNACLLIALEYLRKYRTYFHIAQSYGISESIANGWIEDALIKHSDFRKIKSY
ncbi:transposase family protein [Wolbachia endosymbiont of Nasonia vitripennis]